MTKPIEITIHDQTLAEVDERLFGHFLERASWGEPGPESGLAPGTGHLQPKVVTLLERMQIPIIRFPGGTDVDFIDWRDMVSNVPGRGVERPVTVGHQGGEITNRFGLDEYFDLRDRLGCETILVVNFLDALSSKKPLEEAALHAAGLVAYANAVRGARLPDGMPDWPAVRARNGHPEPFGAEFVQIGNEWWVDRFRQRVRAGTGLSDRDALARWYLACLRAYIDRIRAVDAQVGIIIDGRMGGDLEEIVLADPFVKEQVTTVALHAYAPGPMDNVRRDGRDVAHREMSAEDWWYAWVSMPGEFSAAGENLALGDRLAPTASLGYEVACTEWNWNGWGVQRIDPRPPLDPPLAAGLGAAGFLNGLLRCAGRVRIGCQSMLVGSGWDISAVRVDPTGQTNPYYFPQGLATAFYARHHGPRLLATTTSQLPTFAQPYSVGWSGPKERVAYLDVVATADEDQLFLHAVNRHFDQGFALRIDVERPGFVPVSSRHHLFSGRLRREPQPGQASAVCQVETLELTVDEGRLALELPPRSASIVEIVGC
jgi:alpha-N-arabinofuranosidase